MVQQKVVIINPTGLHLRPAAEFSKMAAKCDSKVSLSYGDKECNAKSSLGIMALIAKKGAEITITCEGASEEQDLKTLVDFVENGLGEL